MHVLRMILVAALLAATPAMAAESDSSSVFGVWRNPKNSVHVDIRGCGRGACGTVLWASPKAQADARKGSGKNLVGMQLFHDLREDGGVWRGKVFVPDLNMTFAGAAETIDGRTLKVRGCVFAGVLCKTQHWTRVNPAT